MRTGGWKCRDDYQNTADKVMIIGISLCGGIVAAITYHAWRLSQ